MASRVITHDSIDEDVRYVVGVDVAYMHDTAFAAAVMFDRAKRRAVHESYSTCRVYIPYIPGLLFLREAAPMLMAIRELDEWISCSECNDHYLLLIDGNGMLHPRLFGLASYIGLMTDSPAIGVSKSLLCGEVSKGSGMVMLNGREVGRVIEYNGKRIYVSIGHKISLDTAERIVRSLITRRSASALGSGSGSVSGVMPEPLRLAHNAASALRRSQA